MDFPVSFTKPTTSFLSANDDVNQAKTAVASLGKNIRQIIQVGTRRAWNTFRMSVPKTYCCPSFTCMVMPL